ncbi:MYXO-CTERM sorting domain-containing protein, partial [Myxococcota bacterium]
WDQGTGIEECDDGVDNSDTGADACRTDCTDATCGDGVTDTGEACDGSGETAACNGDCTATSCGDGVVNTTAGEQCDDGGVSATCNADCSPVSCGDGIVNGDEECDDGGESAACTAECTVVPSSPDDDEGCDCSTGKSGGTARWSLLLLGLGFLRTRRSRRAK